MVILGYRPRPALTGALHDAQPPSAAATRRCTRRRWPGRPTRRRGRRRLTAIRASNSRRNRSGDGPGRAAGPQWGHGRFRPPADDQVSQLGLARHVPVDGRVTHSQRPGHVDYGRLGRAEPADDLLGRGQDPIAGERAVSGGMWSSRHAGFLSR